MEPAPNPILLLASGQRTGSTLLQRFFLSHPNIMMWGEHDGIFSDIIRRYDRMYEWDAMFSHHLETFKAHGYNNFIPNMIPPLETIRESLRGMFYTLYRDPALALNRHIWGFKEVLYDAEDTLRLRDLFPEMKVVFITRHPFNAFTSLLHEERLKPGDINIPLSDIWTREKTTRWVHTWTHINQSFLNHPDITEDWFFRMRYEDLIADAPATTGHMVDWLGLDRSHFDMDVFNHRLYTDRTNQTPAQNRDNRPKITWDDLTAEEYRLMTRPDLVQTASRLGYHIPISS